MDARLKARLPKILLACAAMGLALVGTAALLAPWLYGSPLRYAALGALIGVGMVTYAAAAILTGALRPAELKAMLRR
jgi:putative peptidoglycan lipid II flippase